MTPEDAASDLAKKEKKKGKALLSLERVRLALERLQLGWIRTNLTFIALGFTSYKFFYSRVEEGKEPLSDLVNGRQIGIFLIFIGFLGLILATLQHMNNTARLKIYYKEMYFSVSLLISYFILGFSLLLFLIVIFEL